MRQTFGAPRGCKGASTVADSFEFRSTDEQAEYKQEIVLPLLALNEVFVGESHAARVSYLEIQFDDGPVYKQKNSGVIVCTGTGSTSWYYNVNRLTEQNFTDILTKMREVRAHDASFHSTRPLLAARL